MTDFDIIREALARIEASQTPPVVVVPPTPPTPPTPPSTDAAQFFKDYGAFYDWLRADKMLGPKISTDEFDGCDIICRTAGRAEFGVSWLAYALATAYHETAHTMLPIKERGGDAYYFRMYDIKGNRPAKAKELGNLSPGDGIKYPGRGYPQTTGLANYVKAAKNLKALGLGDYDLIGNPDLMMLPEVAAPTMIYGMRDGWFTGRKLSDTLPARGPATLLSFVASRPIINGTDKDDEIAAYAIGFQKAAVAGGWLIG